MKQVNLKIKILTLWKIFFPKNEKQIFHIVLMVRMKCLSLNIWKYIVKISVMYNILNQIYFYYYLINKFKKISMSTSTTTTTTSSSNL